MKVQLKLALVPMILASVLAACGPQSGSDTKSEISGQSKRLPNGLGQGFESDTQLLKTNCVTGDVQFAGGAQADVTYTQDVSFEDVLDSVSGGLNAGAKFSIFDVKGAADFASKQSSDEFSATVTLTSDASVKSAVMKNMRLTDLGKAMFEDGVVTDKVRKNCGDEFVSQINYSAKLFVNAKFSFATKEDKKNFKGSATLSLLNLGEIGGQIEKMDENIRKTAKVSITARQIGGNPEELSQILTDNVFTCSMAEFESKCLPMLQAVVQYARETFPKSLANDPIPDSSKGWAEVMYKTDKYSDFPLLLDGEVVTLVSENDASIITPEIEEARDTVYESYTSEMKNYDRAVGLLKDFTMGEEPKAKITIIKIAAAANKSSLAAVGEACIRTPLKCVEKLDAYKATRKAYSVDALGGPF
ncbi:MAG: hypothetical protein EOP10_00550 [Proteobacteria bacterium]|nr:MAG: hypothetical protein EOP10_00550 [Pseudomonadota bacterium]